MKITIDENLCKHQDLTLTDVLLILLLKTSSNTTIGEIIEKLLDRHILVKDDFGQVLIASNWDDKVSTILLDSESTNLKSQEEHLDKLVKALMDIFPRGKKDGTNVYWRGNAKDNKLRLKKFFKLYGSKYSDEQIINAAKEYISSFNGSYQYMKVLKYFIWKDVRRIDSEGNGYIEEVSELASYIENANQESLDNDWTSRTI